MACQAGVQNARGARLAGVAGDTTALELAMLAFWEENFFSRVYKDPQVIFIAIYKTHAIPY